jgi:hypothetical protein
MRPAHVTRDGRVICSVKGCGFLIGIIKDVKYGGIPRRAFWASVELIYDKTLGAWRPGRRYRRYGTTHRREPNPFRRINSRFIRLDGRKPFEPELAPEENVVVCGCRLPTTVFCSHGHQSILDPDLLELGLWIDVERRVRTRA